MTSITLSAAQTTSSQPRNVNNILHSLRGEDFRRSLNTTRSFFSSRIRASAQHDGPSLPPLVNLSSEPELLPFLCPAPILTAHPKPAAGPRAPPSWTAPNSELDDSTIDLAQSSLPEQRLDALSFILPRLTNPPSASLLRDLQPRSIRRHVPSLVHLCIEVLLSLDADTCMSLISLLPIHLRRHIAIHCAIHEPPTRELLRLLFRSDGSVGGEVILTRDFNTSFLEKVGIVQPTSTPDTQPSAPDEWDEDLSLSLESSSNEHQQALHTLIIVKATFPASIICHLPPTITHLGLIGVHPTAVQIHRLHSILPLISVIDLSSNFWLCAPAHVLPLLDGEGPNAGHVIDRIRWDRWKRLRAVGLRNCGLPASQSEAIVAEIHRGRGYGVDVVFETLQQ